ncbi:hypothetical protein HPB51_015296 [Rhipicephalus microplus]|uniref:Uncharacterized protein n=1 Tax=Rhipicephalus microplus TaxID=6941 RepID=A0A9J6EH92_RHIMP|nr:hypothetical protein HPB51_015296 [Rhipicephalus microplus]
MKSRMTCPYGVAENVPSRAVAMSNAMYAPNALEGTYVAMGGYDQCLRTRVRSPDGSPQPPDGLITASKGRTHPRRTLCTLDVHEAGPHLCGSLT